MLKNWFRFANNAPARTDAVPESASSQGNDPLASSISQGVFLLRQPVIDHSNQIIGYDIGLRSSGNAVGTDSMVQDLDETVLAEFARLNLLEACQGRLLFVRIAPALLEHKNLALFPMQQVVLAIDAAQPEVLEYIGQAGRTLATQGWQIALDNLYDGSGADSLLSIATFLRFDLRSHNAVDLSQRIKSIRSQKNLTLIARQVESEDDYEASRVMTFDACQGYYFTRVRIDLPRRVDHDRIRVMRMLNMVAQHAEITELDSVIKRDPMLVYKLLMHINSPLSGLDHQLDSIAQALIFLGYEPLYRWLTVLLFTTGVRGSRDRLLLQQALLRARLLELLGLTHLSRKEADALFIVGMFSLLDALLNQPMEQAIEPLHLSAPVRQALLTHDGPLAHWMKLGFALEGGEWYQADELARAVGLDADRVNLLLVEAMTWVVALDNLPND